MVNVLDVLSTQELEHLQDALPQIAILVGMSDGVLEEKELDKAKKITHIRTYNAPDYLNAFYEEVEAKFDKNLDLFLKELPKETTLRNQELSSRLSLLNPILAKLDPKVGAQLYKGFVRFAQEIAKSSGGFLGFMTVNKDESKWVNLPMLTPIDFEEEEE